MSGSAKPEVPLHSAPKAAVHSCRRNISDRTSFVADLRDHIHEFLHASMDEHRTCLRTTVKKLFLMSKADRSAEAQQAGADSVLPLETSVSQ